MPCRDSAIVFETGRPKGSATRLESGVSNGSRLGFRAGQLMSGEKAGTRQNDTVKFTSEKMRGVSIELAYGFGEVPGNSAASRQYGGAVEYETGKLTLRTAFNSTANATGTDRARNTLSGKHTLMTSYIRKDDRSAANKFDAHEYSAVYTYSLSKRTILYAAYAKLSNTNFTTTKFGTGDRETDLGMRLTF